MIRRPPRATRFPNTTLFRSQPALEPAGRETVNLRRVVAVGHEVVGPVDVRRHEHVARLRHELLDAAHDDRAARRGSEGHTSELPSRQYLVCRPLLDIEPREL